MIKKISIILFFILITTLKGDTIVQSSFNAGELSPMVNGRIDIEKYYNGCKTLENMIVTPHGGAIKRPGTKYIATSQKPEEFLPG
jgi:hypothetical protein